MLIMDQQRLHIWLQSCFSQMQKWVWVQKMFLKQWNFFRRVGTKKKFCRHVASDNFQYDAHGYKAISTKDSKCLYIILNQPFSSQSYLTHRQSTNTSIPIDIDFDDDTIKITDDFEVISTLSNYHRGREEAIVSLFSIEATASWNVVHHHFLVLVWVRGAR